MTLVFAKTRTHDSLKEALSAGMTLAYFNDKIAGREEFTRPFFYQIISVGKPFLKNDRFTFFAVTNNSDVPFTLINGPAGAPASIILQANSVTRVALGNKVNVPVVYDVSNIITGENQVLKAEIKY